MDLSLSGAAALNVLWGLVVLKVTGFKMQLGTVSGTDGVTTLTNAQAMAVTLTGVTLWVGPGGSLSDTTLGVANNTPNDFSDDEVQGGRHRLQRWGELAQAGVAEEHRRHAGGRAMTRRIWRWTSVG